MCKDSEFDVSKSDFKIPSPYDEIISTHHFKKNVKSTETKERV